MSKSDSDVRSDWNREAMERGRPQASPPTRQTDPWTYEVYSTRNGGREKVGMLYTEGDANRCVIEHWVIFVPSVSPTADQSLVVERCEKSFTSLAAFFQTMREQARSGSEPRYIKASCDYFDRIPEL